MTERPRNTGGKLIPYHVGDEVGGFKILRVGDNPTNGSTLMYDVERTCECRERLTVSHRKVVMRHSHKLARCRECAAARQSYLRNLNPLRRVWTEERDARLIELIGKRWTAKQIGADIGVSAESVYDRARRLGLRLRKGRGRE